MRIHTLLLGLSLSLIAPAAGAQLYDNTHSVQDTIVQAIRADSTVCIVDRINASGHITVCEPERLTEMLSRRVTAQPQDASAESSEGWRPEIVATRNGYRVQVFDDNNPGTARSQAESRRVQFENAFPQWKAYVTFNSPYWQVRIGDFRRRGEAEAALAQIREAMPSVAAYARIVAEKINITE